MKLKITCLISILLLVSIFYIFAGNSVTDNVEKTSIETLKYEAIPEAKPVELDVTSNETQLIVENVEILTPETINKHIVAIDPGHQLKGNYEKEPVGPGSTILKTKVAAGTYGRTTGKPEYQLTLEVSLLLRDELINRGYDVVMTREVNEVNISNAERAQFANESGAEIFIRIHGDGSDNSSAKGMMAICPTKNNPFCSAIYEDSRRLSDLILSSMFTSTQTNRGRVWETDTMSGINWCEIPVSIIELGFMTNPEEDTLMSTLEYQQKLVEGISNAIDLYFEEK